jgi:hypothetical protein
LVKKKKITKRKENFFVWFFERHNLLQHTLNVIGLIIIIYGAWFNIPRQVVLGFIPILIGYWWEYVNKK